MSNTKPKVLVIGAQFAGLVAAKDLKKNFQVTVVDCKEYFEYTPGILRAYVKPSHFDALTFTTQSVIERKYKIKFLWGEVKTLNESSAMVKPMFGEDEEEITFDYCVIASGCNFGPFHKWGESLWFPTVHECERPEGSWPHIDERFLEGRRRHILEEHEALKALNARGSTVLVVGAGFIGVEWVTELQYFFPKLKLTIIDFLPRPLGPLPQSAADYCEKYMQKVGIKTVYGVKYAPKEDGFYEKIGLSGVPDKTYVCIGVKASNYFMPKDCLSDKGPGGGGWITVNNKMQVITKEGKTWAGGKVFAIGDCNMCTEIAPIPKISYPGEEQAVQVAVSINRMNQTTKCCGLLSKAPGKPVTSWWPWGGGMFATSLGPNDACFVLGAKSKPGTGYMVLWGMLSAIQKEIIEASQVDKNKGGCLGGWIWHYVHHTPVHCIGEGKNYSACTACCGYK